MKTGEPQNHHPGGIAEKLPNQKVSSELSRETLMPDIYRDPLTDLDSQRPFQGIWPSSDSSVGSIEAEIHPISRPGSRHLGTPRTGTWPSRESSVRSIESEIKPVSRSQSPHLGTPRTGSGGGNPFQSRQRSTHSNEDSETPNTTGGSGVFRAHGAATVNTKATPNTEAASNTGAKLKTEHFHRRIRRRISSHETKGSWLRRFRQFKGWNAFHRFLNSARQERRTPDHNRLDTIPEEPVEHAEIYKHLTNALVEAERRKTKAGLVDPAWIKIAAVLGLAGTLGSYSAYIFYGTPITKQAQLAEVSTVAAMMSARAAHAQAVKAGAMDLNGAVIMDPNGGAHGNALLKASTSSMTVIKAMTAQCLANFPHRKDLYRRCVMGTLPYPGTTWGPDRPIAPGRFHRKLIESSTGQVGIP